MALTAYNGYDCAKDKRHTFTPEALDSMFQYDAVVDAAFCHPPTITIPEMIEALKLVLSGQKARQAIRNVRAATMNRDPVSPPDPDAASKREKKRADDRRYYAEHRAHILEQKKAWNKKYGETHTRDRYEYNRLYYEMHRTTINKQQRTRRAEHNQDKQGGQTP